MKAHEHILAGRIGRIASRPLTRRRLLESAACAALSATGHALLGCRTSPEESTSVYGPAPPALLIRNGLLVTHAGRRVADIEVRDGVIQAIGSNLPGGDGVHVLDASGRWVLPGGVDPHTHLHFPYSSAIIESFADDYPTGTRAALAGGVTTVGAITFRRLGEGITDAVRREAEVAGRTSRCDVVLHPTVGAPTLWEFAIESLGGTWQASFERDIDELPELARYGQPSLKIFLSVPSTHAARDRLPALLSAARSHSVISMFHCEDAAVIAEATARLRAEGRDSLRYYAESRPVEAEVAAVRTAVELSERTGASIYIVHLSSARALRVCADARRRGVPVFVETRPTYLHLTTDRYGATDGQKYICEPPLREQGDVEAMWAGLADGTIDCLASDHAPWTLDQKLDPALTFEHHRAGVSNLREMLPMLFSEGVMGGRIAPERFVAVTSTNAARIFGLYPRKGAIAAGSDADLVIWNLDASRTIRRQDEISRSGYSVYEGTQVRAWPEVVIARGAIAVADGEVRRSPGEGRVLRRDASGAWSREGATS